MVVITRRRRPSLFYAKNTAYTGIFLQKYMVNQYIFEKISISSKKFDFFTLSYCTF